MKREANSFPYRIRWKNEAGVLAGDWSYYLDFTNDQNL